VNTQERRDYDLARTKRRRGELITLLGGNCVVCGTTEKLDFDHIDPATKSFTIGNNIFKPWSELLAEVTKCQLLCRPHHIEKTIANRDIKTGGLNRIDKHGTEAYHDRMKCRCDVCVQAKLDARIRRGERKAGVSGKLYDGMGRYGAVEHGGGKTGKHSCKCDLCKAKKAEYAKERKRAKKIRAISSVV
jgi:hypothetical protein